VVVYIESEI